MEGGTDIRLRVSLLGAFRIESNGRAIAVDSWHRSKAKTLIKLLALSAQHRRHGEQLMEVLWPESGMAAAANNLRKAVHHARQMLGADGVTVNGGVIGLPARVWIDVEEFEAAVRSGDVDRALDLYRGDLLPDDVYESWASERREQLRREMSRLLLERAAAFEDEGRIQAAVPLLERLIQLDPLDEEAYTRLMRVVMRSGNRAAALRWYALLEERLRDELGVAPGPAARELREEAAAGRMAGETPVAAAAAMPPIRYARSGDVNVAYQVLGDGPIDLVYVMGWVTHLGFMWQEPLCVRFFKRLAEFSRVILFDKRGTGMSDRVPVDRLPSLERRMDDVRAVMDAAGSRRAAVFGVSEGGPMAALFAATYPERTRALLLYGTYARRLRSSDYPWAPTTEDREAFYHMIENGWGGPVDAAALAPTLAGDEDFIRWWANYCQMAASPASALALARMNSEVDVRDILPSIRVPTLVLHRRDDYESIGGAYYIAEHIPGARMEVLPGADHYIYVGDQEQILRPIETFLSRLDERAVPDTILATIVSIEAGNSERERSRVWSLAGPLLERYRGRDVSHGSRIVASFDGPARAVQYAQTVVTESLAVGVTVRAGVHTGECEVLGDLLRGDALAVASDLGSQARPGEVLASQTVKDLVSGSGLDFEDMGEVEAASGARHVFRVLFTTGERSGNAGRTPRP